MNAPLAAPQLPVAQDPLLLGPKPVRDPPGRRAQDRGQEHRRVGRVVALPFALGALQTRGHRELAMGPADGGRARADLGAELL